MKPTKHILLFAAMLLCSITASAHDFVKNGIYYKLNNNDVADPTVAVTYMGEEIHEYENEYSGHVTIPSTVTYWGVTYRVNEIYYGAFSGCDKLTSIYIPSSITEIRVDAFNYCYGLNKIVFEDGNETLSMEYNSIGWQYGNSHGLFYHCPIESIYLGRNLSYSSLPFENSETLKSVTIGKKVTRIGRYAFKGCKNLTTITIPNNVTSIEDKAFEGCCFTSVDCPEQFRDLFTIVTFVGDFVFRVNDNVLLEYRGTSDVIELPKDFQGNQYTIGDKAFCASEKEDKNTRIIHKKEYENITTVIIPEGVTSIGDYAFSGCSGLTSITIPENSQLTSIGEYAFYECRSLTSITIPEGVTSIGTETFSGCRSLTSITIPASVTSIGSEAFYDCRSLTSINIPASVTSIGEKAFSDCSSLTSINIPASVTSIGEDAFYECRSLKAVTIPKNLQLTRIEKSTFFGCRSLTSINIPEGVTRIGRYAFKGCESLTSITIPESVTSIEDMAFNDCTTLNKVVIEDGGETLSLGYNFNRYNNGREGLFYDCPLETLYLGRNLSYNGGIRHDDSPFYKKDKLKILYIGEKVTYIDEHAFMDCNSLTYVAFYCSYIAPWVRGLSSLQEVILGENVTSIGEKAFEGCRSLTSINIPASVTSIGEKAFYDCRSLKAVTIPEGVTNIENWAFANCRSLTAINIPEGVTSIGDYAFYDCRSLTSIIFPKSVTSIGNSAFEYCRSLTTLIVPKSWKKTFKKPRSYVSRNYPNLKKITYVK